MRAIIIMLVLVSQVPVVHATMDGWESITPGGLVMRGGNVLKLAPDRFVHGMDKWYFYRGHILGHFDNGGQIGDYDSPHDPSLQWVIVDERTTRVWTFTTTDAWENARHEMGLKPVLWERWYWNDWRVLTNGFALFLYAVFLAIPVLLLTGLIVLLVVKKIIAVKYVWRGLAVIGMIYLVGVLLELYPQSF